MEGLSASAIYAGVLLAQRGLHLPETRRLEIVRMRVGPADEGSYDYDRAESFIEQFGTQFFSSHHDYVFAFRETLMNYVLSGGVGWPELIPSGRRLVLRSLTPNEHQCFEIAGLLDGTDPATVEWWDVCAAAIRLRLSNDSANDGREAERLSLQVEVERLAGSRLEPVWMALEDNGFGCDIQTYRPGVNGWDDAQTHFIEVKSTIGRPRFYISRNEWNFARRHADSWELHFWDMRSEQVQSLSFDNLESHIPRNYGSGEWISAVIPLEGFGV